MDPGERGRPSTGPRWPDGKGFAFTIFDDPDGQSLEDGREAYSLLADLGFRTTKAIWPIGGRQPRVDWGDTCANPDYLAWVLELRGKGFEIGYHNATYHTSDRDDTARGLDEFARHFGRFPLAAANHYACKEAIYWGDSRLTGVNRFVYNALTRWKNRGQSFGHVPGHQYFWGDLCRERIRYVRNFVFAEINTLSACPFMPYHDPQRPFVPYWFSAAEGSNVDTFIRRLSEPNQDRLEEEGGACIMYVHFGHGFREHGALNRRFVELMRRLSAKNGWFVPASSLLDYLLSLKGDTQITDAQRAELERRWLWHKVRFGSA